MRWTSGQREAATRRVLWEQHSSNHGEAAAGRFWAATMAGAGRVWAPARVGSSVAAREYAVCSENMCGVRSGARPPGERAGPSRRRDADSGPIHGHPRAPSLCPARWADSPEHSVTFIASFSDIFTS